MNAHPTIIDRRAQYRERLRRSGKGHGTQFKLRQLAGLQVLQILYTRQAARMFTPVLPRVDAPPKARSA